MCKWGSVCICCDESPHAEALDPLMRLFHTVSLGTWVNRGPGTAPSPVTASRPIPNSNSHSRTRRKAARIIRRRDHPSQLLTPFPRRGIQAPTEAHVLAVAISRQHRRSPYRCASSAASRLTTSSRSAGTRAAGAVIPAQRFATSRVCAAAPTGPFSGSWMVVRTRPTPLASTAAEDSRPTHSPPG
jgi:hypothetical protein